MGFPHGVGGQHVAGGPQFSGGSGRSQVSRWKEFKINGQIGSAGQKDKLTYTSLSFQINSARQRGFADIDICAAVIKAIAPGEGLRPYLEMCHGLTLETLIPILRAHFKEKDATLVYTELSNGAQGPTESENDFCLRMMALRQKVLLMSKEENGQYTEELVQTQFQKSLATGFRREAVRQHLRAVLKLPVEDIDLLQEISDVVMTETEHDSKIKPAKVNVNVVNVPGETNASTNTKASKPANPVIAEITKLTSQVSQLSGLHTGLQDEMEKLKQKLLAHNPGQSWAQNPVNNGGNANGIVPNTNPAPPAPPNNGAQNANGNFRGRGRGRGAYRGARGGGRRHRIGCDACVQAGIFCNHCLLCLQIGHKIADCPLQQKNEDGDQN